MSRIVSTPRPGPRSGMMPRPSLADDLRRRAAGRLADRLDPAKNRFKPLSLLRTEARRVVEQFLDAEAPGLPKPDRDRLSDEVLADAPGLGPLEELFRDEAVREFTTLAYNQVIARKGEHWLPTSVHFPTPELYRQALQKLAETGEPVGGPPPGGGCHVRLGNGWRMLAVVPPAVLDQPPLATFAREAAAKPAPPPGTDGPTPKTDVVIRRPPPQPQPPSGTVSFSEPRPTAGSGPTSGTRLDPVARIKQKVTERLIDRLSAAGVYDIGKLPGNELRLVVMGFVEEVLIAERMSTMPTEVERLALDILKGMHR